MLPYPQRRGRAGGGPDPLAPTAADHRRDHRPAALEAVFARAVTDGCEGLVCKSTGPDSAYQAWARGWQ
jgi:ATP-dependent DNA ligase